jgi:pimeloyl-ACP methyl ester carboxylesterase
MAGNLEIERGLIRTSAGYIHYRAAGSGAPIVLLHINQQSSALFLELMTVLGRESRAIAIDYPSHGMSDHVGFQPTIAHYASWVIEVLDGLGVERASVLGEAVGAVIAIELAASYPGRMEKIILVNCPYYRDTATSERSASALKGGLRPADASGFPTARTIEFMLQQDSARAPMQPSQSWMDRINIAQVEAGRDRWQALTALHQYDIPGNLPRVSLPVLMLMGEHFQYTKFLEEFTSRIRNLESRIIEGGRFCLTWERAEEISQRTLAFLRN